MPSKTERLGETKRQHYVPRMILRNFTRDRKRISLIADGRRIDGASIATQCCEDYFYGADNIMEKAFASSEGDMAAFLGDLGPERFSSLSGAQIRDLMLFMAFQRCRTLGAAQHTSNFVSSFVGAATEAAEAMSYNAEPSDDAQDSVTYGLDNPQPDALWLGVKTMPVFADLSIKFIVTDRTPGFVIADNPVVAYNQFAEHHPILSRYPGGTGNAHKGLQLFFPLSPSVTLAVFDPAVYTYSGKTLICRAGPQDVELLNRMQAVNALQCIYFHEDRIDERTVPDLTLVRSRHPSIYKKTMITSGDFVIALDTQLRLGGRLSFVREIDGHNYEDYEGASVPPRSWEVLRLAEQFGKRLESIVAERVASHPVSVNEQRPPRPSK